METKKVFEQILSVLRDIDKKLEKIAHVQNMLLDSWTKKDEGSSKNLPIDVEALLSLPDHLRKTAMAINELGSASADQIASRTGRTRAAESDYLNQLIKLGYLNKERRGRTAYFSV